MSPRITPDPARWIVIERRQAYQTPRYWSIYDDWTVSPDDAQLMTYGQASNLAAKARHESPNRTYVVLDILHPASGR